MAAATHVLIVLHAKPSSDGCSGWHTVLNAVSLKTFQSKTMSSNYSDFFSHSDVYDINNYVWVDVTCCVPWNGVLHGCRNKQ